MAKTKLNEGDFKDGVYFNMPEEDYHRIPRLSSSGIKKLLISPMDFWATSFLNPNAEQYTTKALTAGSAFHARMLEGKDVFESRYVPELEAKEGWLVKQAELKAKCKELELPVGGSKVDLAMRLLKVDNTLDIYDVKLAVYKETYFDEEHIDKKLYNQTQHAAELLGKNESLNHFFKNGHAEVSVLWTCVETGIPMKARFDYLTPKGVEDLKTFSNSLGKPLSVNISQSMANYKYHIQAVLYLEAFSKILDLLQYGHKKEGDLFNPNTTISPTFQFLFQQTGAAPVARGFNFKTDGLAFSEGARAICRAKKLFKASFEQWGCNEWYDHVPIVDMDDEFYPMWMFD